MERLYTIIFLVGVIYTVATFVLGGIFDFLHFGGHVDTHIDGHIHTHVEGSSASPTFTLFPFRPVVVISFLTVFGGIGIIGTRYGFNPILTFIVAAVCGRIVSFMLYKLVVIPLYRAQNTSAVSQEELIGIKAVVISPILEEGFGVIAYEVNGSKYNAPSQHISKQAVALGEEVIIYEIKDNVFYVQPLTEKNIDLQI